MKSNTSVTLLHRLRDGTDPLAWDEFFARYWPLVYALARHRGCSEHTSEEIVQDVVLKVFERRDVFRYDSSRGRFRDWLSTLVRNQVIDYQRRACQRVRGAGGQEDLNLAEAMVDEPGPEAAWENAFEEGLLMAMLGVLRREMNPRAYLAFELFALREVPCVEVAGITGLTRNVVYKTRKKALRRLRELAGSYQEDGRLQERIKQALATRPRAAVMRSMTARVEKTMRP